jgi:hypothetical protein
MHALPYDTILSTVSLAVGQEMLDPPQYGGHCPRPVGTPDCVGPLSQKGRSCHYLCYQQYSATHRSGVQTVDCNAVDHLIHVAHLNKPTAPTSDPTAPVLSSATFLAPYHRATLVLSHFWIITWYCLHIVLAHIKYWVGYGGTNRRSINQNKMNMQKCPR